MTQVLDIITRSYRESNLFGISGSPTALQISEGLARLQTLIASTYGWDVGEDVTDLHVGYVGQVEPDYDITQRMWTRPETNTRLVLNHDGPETIYFPRLPRHGSRMSVVDVYDALALYNITLDANGNTIEDVLQVVLSTNGLNRTWIYDASASNWQIMPTVTSETDEMPFPIEFDDYFIIKLASRLNPAYGRSLSQESIMRLQDQQGQIEARYKQTRSKPVADSLAMGLRTPGRYGRRLTR